MLSFERIDVCPDDCVLFRGEYADLDACPKCGKSRYADSKRKKPNRIFRFCSVKDRIKRLFASPLLAELILHPHTRTKPPPGVIESVYDGALWKDKFEKLMGESQNNLAFSLCADGIDILNKGGYSIWPFLLQDLSLPTYVRSLNSMLWLTGLTQGPNVKSLNPYLELICDDFAELYDVGMKVYNGFSKSVVKCRAMLLFTVADYKAFMKMVGIISICL
jgi:hypothetical protein